MTGGYDLPRLGNTDSQTQVDELIQVAPTPNSQRLSQARVDTVDCCPKWRFPKMMIPHITQVILS